MRFVQLRLLVPVVLSVAAILPTVGNVSAQGAATTVFKGHPQFKISEGGIERRPDAITRDTAVNLACVISKIGDNFYWASRENVPMVQVDSGAFVTYIALNGAGHVRVVKSERKAEARLMSPTEAQFDYVEHALIGLRSVTYYGVRVQ